MRPLIKACRRSWFIQANKAELRQAFRASRNHIPLPKQADAAQTTSALFTAHSWFLNSKHIACYFPAKNEVDCKPIIEAIWLAKKYCYLPVLLNNNEMNFVLYQKNDPMKLNQYSILEPIDVSQTILPAHLDCVVMPLIAFDKKGHRLGAGGGYYDRTFAFLHEQEVRKPYLIGLAYSIQEAEILPVEEWDVGLDGVVMEKKVWGFNR